ncbi:MAG: peptidoglycan binding domain-containing protein [Anaerolineae bacterium]
MRQNAQTHSNHREPDSRGDRSCLLSAFVAALLLALVGAAAFSIWMVQQTVLTPYETRIYPNVYVLDENLGGLTPQEAADHLERMFAKGQFGDLILSDGEQTWRVPWAEAGMELDAEATAQQAFAVGRKQGWRTLVQMWLGEGRWGTRCDIPPVFAIDARTTRDALEEMAELMREPPVDTALRLEGDQVVVTPSHQGRELNVDATVQKIVDTVTHLGPDYPFAPTYRAVAPRIADVGATRAIAEEMLTREIRVVARGEHEGEPATWSWTLGRDAIADWLRVEKTEDDAGFLVRVDEKAVQARVADLAREPEADRWGFPTGEVTEQVLDTFRAGGGEVTVELTPPPRIYLVQPGDRLTTIAARFGMPPGLIAEANPGVDLNRLYVDQELIIPPQDVLTPHDPVPGKKIVISIPEQRLRVYENDELLYDWPCSTGMRDSPTYTGEFQVLSQEEMAYASQWDLHMPHFIGVYRAGGSTYNGIHALPILSSGQRLWAGNLGSPASYGCIILGIEEAETLYNWAELGIPVTIQ